MEAKEIVKMSFDNDVEILEEAFKSDAELYEKVVKMILTYNAKILMLLVKKDIITEKELETFLKDESIEKELGWIE